MDINRFFKGRFPRLAARTMLVAVCLSVTPLALAATPPASAPSGANYLLAQNMNYQHQGFSNTGNGVGSTAPLATPVPEPATWGMFGIGLLMIGLGVARRRQFSASRSID